MPGGNLNWLMIVGCDKRQNHCRAQLKKSLHVILQQSMPNSHCICHSKSRQIYAHKKTPLQRFCKGLEIAEKVSSPIHFLQSNSWVQSTRPQKRATRSVRLPETAPANPPHNIPLTAAVTSKFGVLPENQPESAVMP